VRRVRRAKRVRRVKRATSTRISTTTFRLKTFNRIQSTWSGWNLRNLKAGSTTILKIGI